MRICFLALNAFPTLAGTSEASVGGAEVQQKFISRYLAGQGHDVSFVTRDHGHGDGEKISGIRVYRTFRKDAGIPYFRFFYPRLTSIWAALKRADAEVYYQRCAGMETGLLAAFCRVYDKKFVFAAASESDFDMSQVITASRRDKWLYLYGLKRANTVVVQTRRQQQLLGDRFGMSAEVMPNCWGSEGDIKTSDSHKGKNILWVSTMRDWKHPEQIPEIARQLPDMRFVMVGGEASGEHALFERVRTEAANLDNVDFRGFVPFSEVGQYFDNARILVNTSDSKEGFPNTFLQAWMRGIPVVSFFDPDELIDKEELGYKVSSLSEMMAALSRLEDADTYSACSLRAIEYFRSSHLVDTIGARYEQVFRKLAQ